MSKKTQYLTSTDWPPMNLSSKEDQTLDRIQFQYQCCCMQMNLSIKVKPFYLDLVPSIDIEMSINFF